MNADSWETLSSWFNAWLAADSHGRAKLRDQLTAEHPDLVSDADALVRSAGQLQGFLETPALVLAAGELAEEDALLPPGAMIGPYRIVELLARGGMGDVYRATDERLRRDVAVKVLAETKSGDPRRVERFTHEARVTASLDHRNIVRVYDVGRVEGRAYLVAELLEGETLRARIARGPIPVDDVLSIGVEIATGLSAAHAAGLVHRDLKPDNIFLTRSGTTKILDFGIAKLAQDDSVRNGLSTLTGVVLGTAGYLAPEQIRGVAVDGRADLFTLGVVLFEMLTGVRAFGREHMVDMLHAILHDPPSDALAQRDEVPPALMDVILTLLEKTPAARFQSAEEVIAALQEVKTLGPATRKAPWRRTLVREARSRPRLALAAIIGLVVAVLAGVSYTLRPPKPTLAVMPFRTVPALQDGNALGLGLADLLVNRLGQVSGVSVLAAVDTAGLRRSGIDTTNPGDVARRLSASHVLMGTLLRERGRVRVTAQLFSASDGRVLTLDPIDVAEESVFSVQDSIAGLVVRELESRSRSDMQEKPPAPGTRNPQAWSAFASGRAIVLRPIPEDLKKAAGYFEEAIRLDPGYADAWASLGSAYKRMPILGGMESTVAFPKARKAAETALAIDPNNVEAISVLGTVEFWYDWEYDRSEELLRQALRLNSSHADSHLFLAHVLSNTGRFDEALTEIRVARVLDQQWVQARALEGQFLTMSRRHDEAIKYLDAVVTDIDPGSWTAHLFRAGALFARGRNDEALAACDRALELRSNPAPLALKGSVLARMNRRDEAHAVLTRLPATSHYARALLLHALGRDDEAIAALALAIDNRIVHVTFLGVDPQWDRLRDWPPFQEQLARVNLRDVSRKLRR